MSRFRSAAVVRLPLGVDLDALAAEQVRLAGKVVRRDDFGGLRNLKLVAGVDVTYANGMALAAAVVVERGSLAVVEEAVAERSEEFPYIPGFLSFRELPVAVDALRSLRTKPRLIMVDALGVLHPRDFGFASHLGLELDVPTIGVAKSLWCGEVEGVARTGKPAPIRWHGKVGGYAVLGGRARNPVYATIGHRVGARTAARLVAEMAVTRIPEPTRQAHLLAARTRREGEGREGAVRAHAP